MHNLSCDCLIQVALSAIKTRMALRILEIQSIFGNRCEKTSSGFEKVLYNVRNDFKQLKLRCESTNNNFVFDNMGYFDNSTKCRNYDACRFNQKELECFSCEFPYKGEKCNQCIEGYFKKNEVCHRTEQNIKGGKKFLLILFFNLLLTASIGFLGFHSMLIRKLILVLQTILSSFEIFSFLSKSPNHYTSTFSFLLLTNDFIKYYGRFQTVRAFDQLYIFLNIFIFFLANTACQFITVRRKLSKQNFVDLLLFRNKKSVLKFGLWFLIIPFAKNIPFPFVKGDNGVAFTCISCIFLILLIADIGLIVYSYWMTNKRRYYPLGVFLTSLSQRLIIAIPNDFFFSIFIKLIFVLSVTLLHFTMFTITVKKSMIYRCLMGLQDSLIIVSFLIGTKDIIENPLYYNIDTRRLGEGLLIYLLVMVIFYIFLLGRRFLDLCHDYIL